jgi:hypothetical protein
MLLNADWCKIKDDPCHFRSCAGIDVVLSAPALEFLDDEPASNAEVIFSFFLVPVFEKKIRRRSRISKRN